VDLSFPVRVSINDDIPPELSSIWYVPVDHLSSLILLRGREAFQVLCSTPKISAVTDALQWIIVKKEITNLLHYLDDFIFVSKSLEKAKNMLTLVSPSTSPRVLLNTF